MPRSTDITLKEALQKMVKTYHLEGKLNEMNLVSSWARLMGTAVGNRTTEIFIRDKKLFVSLSSASLREELNMNRHKILDLLNEEAGTRLIEEVVFC